MERNKAEGLASAPRAALARHALRFVEPFFDTRKEAHEFLKRCGAGCMALSGILFCMGTACTAAAYGIGYSTPSTPWAFAAYAGFGAVGTVLPYYLLSGMAKAEVAGPAAWETRDYEARRESLIRAGALHPEAQSLISDIEGLLPGCAFQVDSLVRDGSASARFLRVHWTGPSKARESRVVFGWNGMSVLNPS